MIDYTAKRVVLTGAAGGIGAATARLLARLGARLILVDRHAPGLIALARDIGPSAQAAALDITDTPAVAALFARLGPIDLLINNAAALGPEMGPPFDRDVETTALDVWQQAFAVNVHGTVAMCKHALAQMPDGGCILNVASNLALQGNSVQCAYSSSKAAVIQLSRCIAASHGHRNIRCNAVLPGLTLTPAVRDHMPAAHQQAVFAENLLPQPGRPEDLAHLIAFLGSDAARNITGQAIVSDAGNSSHVPGAGHIATA